MTNYEIGIYNMAVRELVGDGQSHPDLSDAWADIHFIEIRGRDRSHALTKLRARYPEIRGFVISEILEIG